MHAMNRWHLVQKHHAILRACARCVDMLAWALTETFPACLPMNRPKQAFRDLLGCLQQPRGMFPRGRVAGANRRDRR